MTMMTYRHAEVVCTMISWVERERGKAGESGRDPVGGYFRGVLMLIGCLPSYPLTTTPRASRIKHTKHLRIRNRTENVDGARNYTSECLLF